MDWNIRDHMLSPGTFPRVGFWGQSRHRDSMAIYLVWPKVGTSSFTRKVASKVYRL